MVKIKNQQSKGKNSFDKIQSILAKHGANKIMYDYATDGSGRLTAITFGMTIGDKQVGFKLPALVDNVVYIMYGGKDKWGREKKITDAQKEQGYKTAWANIRDWVDAQMALIDTEQVKMEQVFLPYMLNKSGETLFEQINNNQFKLLE